MLATKYVRGAYVRGAATAAVVPAVGGGGEVALVGGGRSSLACPVKLLWAAFSFVAVL